MTCLKAPIRLNSGMPTEINSYIADTEAERPSTAVVGEDCYCKDTKKTYTCTAVGPVTWEQTGGSGGQGGGAGQLVVPIVLDPAAIVWTNMPLAATFWNGSHRHVLKADLSTYTQCRLIVNKQATAGAAASKLILRYRTAFSTTVGDYSDIGTSEVSVACNVQNAIQASNWINLAAGAKADVFVALVGSGGDGALDPTFGSIVAQFK